MLLKAFHARSQVPGSNSPVIVMRPRFDSLPDVIFPKSDSFKPVKTATDARHLFRHNPTGMTFPTASRVWLITGMSQGIGPPSLTSRYYPIGTSSGFGRRLVSIVVSRGDRVIATAKTLTNITYFLEDSTLQGASSIHCAELDVSLGSERVKERIDAIIQASGWGSVDVLVNNAGIGIPAFLEEGGYVVQRIYRRWGDMCFTEWIYCAISTRQMCLELSM